MRQELPVREALDPFARWQRTVIVLSSSGDT